MGGLITTDDLNGIAYTTAGETFEIARATLVYSGGSLESAVAGSQQQSTLLNHGFLVATDFLAVAFGGDDAVITNTATGSIRGAVGVGFSGSGLSLGNQGDIECTAYGVFFESASGVALNNSGTIFGGGRGILDQSIDGATINNTGIIKSDQVAIRVEIPNGQTININNGAGGVIDGDSIGIYVLSGRLVLTNNGTINGAVLLFETDENDIIINKGTIRDKVDLGAGNDVYTGSAIDVLGGFGNDKLTGGNTNDAFDGGDGNDIIAGGRGRDLLTGGPDRDIFDFNSISDSKVGSARDVIRDFFRGNNTTGDDIDLSTIDAKSGVSGNNAFKFIGKQGFHDVKGELRYIDKGSTVIVQGDVNGDGKADFEIFVNVGALSKGDFLL